MSPARSRWKPFILVAAVACVVIPITIAAHPRLKSLVVGELEGQATENRKAGFQPPPTPLGDDLKRGRWKAGDSVEDVLACYKDEWTVHSGQVGEFTVIGEYRRADYGPIRELDQIIAVGGRLKAAIARRQPEPPFSDWGPHIFFDTLTEDEWAAYHASCAFSSSSDWAKGLWANSRSGRRWFINVFISAWKLVAFGG